MTCHIEVGMWKISVSEIAMLKKYKGKSTKQKKINFSLLQVGFEQR